MTDFFDQNTGREELTETAMVRPDGASILINGSYIEAEVGSRFLDACQNAALQAGFGKFRVLLNGAEVRPSTVRDRNVETDDSIEIRPYDEAG